MPNLSVVIPVYNEEQAIGGVVAELHAALTTAADVAAFEILVVDDGSTDSTVQAARAAAEGRPEVRLLARDRNRGYGSAIKHGIRHAAHGLIAIVDGDGSYPAGKLPELLDAMGDAAMVVGERPRAGAIPLLRRPAKWLLTRLASYLADERIPDLNSGMRVFRREVYDRYMNLLPRRFSFTTTLTLAVLCDDLPVVFAPIEYRPRLGRSKIRPVRDTLGFLLLIARTVTHFRPLKVLGPLAAAVFLAGAVKGAWNLLAPDNPAGEPNLKTSDLLLLVAGVQLFALAMLADLVAKRR
ncbi:MAG TPA: glycosyltransferase family 2 protein [Planctomycetota bacterium]|nr:glycosyltransferase family 2 protein [Planctomycetota bacterium]